MKRIVYVCDNCGHEYDRDANGMDEPDIDSGRDFVPLDACPDLDQRLDPGSVVPHGECTQVDDSVEKVDADDEDVICGAFVYRKEV